MSYWEMVEQMRKHRMYGRCQQLNKNSERKEDSMDNWIMGLLSCILVRNLAVFCPCPEKLIEDKLKSRELIYWQENFFFFS